MSSDTQRQFWYGEGLAGLWFGLLAGPLAWALDEEISYALVQRACRSGHATPLHFMTLVSLTIAAVGAGVSWSCFRRLPPATTSEGARPVDRSHFMALAGLILCGMFFLVIVAGAIPRWVLNPCE